MIAESTTVRARDGFELAVQARGPAGAPVLLLLQGQANSHRWWDGIRDAFEGEFRTIPMDYRGTGSSRGPVEHWTIAGFAADAADVLAGVGVRRALVYGTSMGGRVAQMLAVNHPQRVAALVLACTSPGGTNAVPRPRGVSASLAAGSPDERLAILHRLFYTPAWPHAPRDSFLLGDPTMTRAEASAHRKASRQHDAWEFLPDLDVPTLVLHGDDDQMTPVENARLLAERIPAAELRIYPGGRHGFFEEFSAQVNPVVAEFFAAFKAPARQ